MALAILSWVPSLLTPSRSSRLSLLYVSRSFCFSLTLALIKVLSNSLSLSSRLAYFSLYFSTAIPIISSFSGCTSTFSRSSFFGVWMCFSTCIKLSCILSTSFLLWVSRVSLINVSIAIYKSTLSRSYSAPSWRNFWIFSRSASISSMVYISNNLMWLSI